MKASVSDESHCIPVNLTLTDNLITLQHLLQPSTCFYHNYCKRGLLSMFCRFQSDTASTIPYPALLIPHHKCSWSRQSFLLAS